MDSHILHTDRRSSFGLGHKSVTRKLGGKKKGNAKGNKQKGQQGNANYSLAQCRKNLERAEARETQKLAIDKAVADEIAEHLDAVDDPALFKQYYGEKIQQNHEKVEQNKQDRKNMNERIENAIKQTRAEFQTEKDELNAIRRQCHVYTQVMDKAFHKSYKAWKKEMKAELAENIKPVDGTPSDNPDMPDEVPTTAEIPSETGSRFGSLPAYLRPLKAI